MAKKPVSDKDFERMEKIPNVRDKYVHRGFYFYLSYSLRVFLMCLVVVVCGILTFMCFDRSFSKKKDIVLQYNEQDYLDYDVKLLNTENNPFGNGTLKPGEYYISSIIDDISTDLAYSYTFDKNVDVKYSYSVEADLKLKDDKTGNVLADDTYTLIETTDEKEEKDVNKVQINQNVNVDYNYYNGLAKEFASLNNDIDAIGDFLVKLHINLEIKYKGFDEPIKKEYVVAVNIPLLSSQVKIEKVSNPKGTGSYVKHVKAELTNEALLYVGIVLLIIDTLLLLIVINFIIKTLPKKTIYCQVRDRILNNYDKIIVNSKKVPEIAGYNVIECENFGELLDAQTMLNKPIVYFEVIKNQKSVFVLINDNDAYRYTLKECDVDDNIS